MICACRLQEMNLPCYSAVERLLSARWLRENEDTTGWKSDCRLDFSACFPYYDKQNVEKQRKRQYE